MDTLNNVDLPDAGARMVLPMFGFRGTFQTMYLSTLVERGQTAPHAVMMIMMRIQ
jgi:hypothetical protein